MTTTELREFDQLMNKLGISHRKLGRTYITDMISRAEKDNIYGGFRVTKDGYPVTAKRYRTTCSRVERACRYAIETGFEKNSVAWNLELNLFCCPSVGEFINALLNHYWVDIAG